MDEIDPPKLSYFQTFAIEDLEQSNIDLLRVRTTQAYDMLLQAARQNGIDPQYVKLKIELE